MPITREAIATPTTSIGHTTMDYKSDFETYTTTFEPDRCVPLYVCLSLCLSTILSTNTYITRLTQAWPNVVSIFIGWGGNFCCNIVWVGREDIPLHLGRQMVPNEFSFVHHLFTQVCLVKTFDI